MSLPDDLNQALENCLDKIPRSILTAAAMDLTQRYRGSERDQLSSFMISDHHRFSYLAVRMPATFAVIKRVLEECKHRVQEFSPTSVCDLGAGPGTATWAAIHVFPEITKAFLHEKDADLLKLGQSLMQQAHHETLKVAHWKQTDLVQENNFDFSDLIILSYVVGELRQEAMIDLISKAWDSSSQMLVVIEPGTPHGFQRILAARTHLIQLGANLVAPCPHHQKCPMEKGDWCHFAERLERSSLHRAVKDVSLGYEDEKYSYVVASKNPVALPDARILRHPQHHSGHIDFVLCAKEGLEKKVISRRHKELYKLARKLDWGDVL